MPWPCFQQKTAETMPSTQALRRLRRGPGRLRAAPAAVPLPPPPVLALPELGLLVRHGAPRRASRKAFRRTRLRRPRYRTRGPGARPEVLDDVLGRFPLFSKGISSTQNVVPLGSVLTVAFARAAEY